MCIQRQLGRYCWANTQHTRNPCETVLFFEYPVDWMQCGGGNGIVYDVVLLSRFICTHCGYRSFCKLRQNWRRQPRDKNIFPPPFHVCDYNLAILWASQCFSVYDPMLSVQCRFAIVACDNTAFHKTHTFAQRIADASDSHRASHFVLTCPV